MPNTPKSTGSVRVELTQANLTVIHETAAAAAQQEVARLGDEHFIFQARIFNLSPRTYKKRYLQAEREMLEHRWKTAAEAGLYTIASPLQSPATQKRKQEDHVREIKEPSVEYIPSDIIAAAPNAKTARCRLDFSHIEVTHNDPNPVVPAVPAPTGVFPDASRRLDFSRIPLEPTQRKKSSVSVLVANFQQCIVSPPKLKQKLIRRELFPAGVSRKSNKENINPNEEVSPKDSQHCGFKRKLTN